MKQKTFVYGIAMILSAMTTLIALGQDDPPEAVTGSNWNGDALEILTGSTRFVEAAEAFRVSGHTGGELMLENGQLIEYGTAFRATFVRPSKLHLYMNSRDGIDTRLIFDSKTITAAIYANDRHTYDTTLQIGDVNESMDFVTHHVGSSREMASFLTRHLTQSLSSVKSGLSLGKSTIDGVVCDHLVLRSDTRDGQVWIARGDSPTPRRILITHRNKPEKPRFWIQFDEWDLSPVVSEATFNYLPPEGAERVDYFQE